MLIVVVLCLPGGARISWTAAELAGERINIGTENEAHRILWRCACVYRLFLLI